MNAFSILTGVGRLYIAPVGTAFPILTATPASPWRDLGDTQNGVDVDHNEKIDKITTDQRTGDVKAIRSAESVIIKTSLAEGTLENLADALGVTLTYTPAASGVIGTRAVGLYRGATVVEHAILFRGYSSYYDGPAQYQIPRMIFGKIDVMKYEKGKNTPIPVTFEALEDLNASTAIERFGKFIAQDSAALP